MWALPRSQGENSDSVSIKWLMLVSHFTSRLSHMIRYSQSCVEAFHVRDKCVWICIQGQAWPNEAKASASRNVQCVVPEARISILLAQGTSSHPHPHPTQPAQPHVLRNIRNVCKRRPATCRRSIRHVCSRKERHHIPTPAGTCANPKKNELICVPKTLHGRDSRRWPCSKHKNDAPRRENCNVSKKGSWSEKLHRICHGFGVSTRTHVRNYSGRNVEWRLCGSRLKAWYLLASFSYIGDYTLLY